MESTKSLKNIRWLAARLGLSVSTIKRYRTQKDQRLLPPAIHINKTIRYDEDLVDQWIKEQQLKTNQSGE